METSTTTARWPQRAGDLWRMALLAAATLVIYRDTLTAFYWHDDFQMLKMVQRNTFTEYLLSAVDRTIPIYGPVRPLWRPLTHYVYWAVNWRLFHTEPLGYHLVTLLLHTLNVLLVYGAARLLLRRPMAAFAAAVLYASATLVHAESLYVIAAVNELGMAAFLFLSLLIFLWRGQGRLGRAAPVLSLVAFAGALLCKEASIVYPVVLFAYCLLFPEPGPPGPRQRLWLAVRRTWPFWLLSLAYAGLRLPVILSAASGDSSRYAYVFGLWVLPKYFWGVKWLFEVYVAPLQRLTALLPEAIPANLLAALVLGVSVAAGLGYGAWRLATRRGLPEGWQVLVFGLVWFVTMPLSIIFAIPFSPYLFVVPAFGLHLAAGFLADAISIRLERLVRGGRAVFYLVFAGLTLASALAQSRAYALDPHSMAQQGRLSRQVLAWLDERELDYTHIAEVVFVGFPSDLFAINGEPKRSADAVELFLGSQLRVTQMAALADLTLPSCDTTLIFVYDAVELMQAYQPPECGAP